MRNNISKEEKDIFEEIGLATKREGMGVGFAIALLLHMGILDITMVSQETAFWILFLSGIGLAVWNLAKNKPFFGKFVDGLIIGLGLTYGIIRIVVLLLL